MINVLFLIVGAITLFLYGLQNFSKEIRSFSEGSLKKNLELYTKNRFAAAFVGVLATAVIQSSSAVVAISVALLDAGLLTFNSVIGIIIGANIGTVSTAFLVSLKINALGGYLIVVGSLLSVVKSRFQIIGKTVFYLGFIFFALEQISISIQPLQGNLNILYWLSYSENKFIGFLLGILLAILLQSSSVLLGLVVLLADQGLLSLASAISIMLGANIGTTSTALLASYTLNKNAKLAAIGNFIFNSIGAIVFLFLIPSLSEIAIFLGGSSISLTVAYANLIFNLINGAVFMLVFYWFIKVLKSIRF